MPTTLTFDDCARLPLPEDNVAIVTRRLDRGTRIETTSGEITLTSTLLEGHRFALYPIPLGDPLLSWGLPFGVCTKAIGPGDYVCNVGILEALGLRRLDFDLPEHPNFEDRIVSHTINADDFVPGTQVSTRSDIPTFEGYRRGSRRGVGTRNYVVLLGTSSRTGSFVRALEGRLKELTKDYPNIDGIVAIAHTEGGERDRPNNIEHILRTLGGFTVHPNVGAILAVDYGTESVTNAMLERWIRSRDLPVDEIPHAFYTITSGLQTSLDEASKLITSWLPKVNSTVRSTVPAGTIKLALQCGGSDAFSGVSGNPLASWVARELIRCGGAANLAETDELIGAEAYVLQNVRDLETAERFVEKVEAYKRLAAWHGTSAEGNPSGGNKYRGLYNIVLKSIGAAMKRHPEVRLDHVIDYGQHMADPGYYFMDSPGNDLESIAGQVASGCNMIYFVTGNGSITNFPFVPTIKIVTTSARYEMLSQEMDVNAGAYLDGTSMDDLGAQTLDLTLQVASGQRSKGEAAGHAQVSLWRNWRQTGSVGPDTLVVQSAPTGDPLPIATDDPSFESTYTGFKTEDGVAADSVGLILPTSLCAGQIARMCAEHLQDKGVGVGAGLTRYTALVHTEGCGVAGEETEQMYTETMLGYLTHPLVSHAFVLEHGCEKTHNDFMRHHIAERGLGEGRFGWASIQLDGGITAVMELAEAWFAERVQSIATMVDAPLSSLRVGLAAEGETSPHSDRLFAELTRRLVGSGATVVLPQSTRLLTSDSYLGGTLGGHHALPSIAYGQRPTLSGFHIMACPTEHWVESLTGLGGTGVDLILVLAGEHPLQGHPLVPVIQVGADPCAIVYGDDLDLTLNDDSTCDDLLNLALEVASRRMVPKALSHGLYDFQFTRGLLGVSM
jgi:altronate dehydratase